MRNFSVRFGIGDGLPVRRRQVGQRLTVRRRRDVVQQLRSSVPAATASTSSRLPEPSCVRASSLT